MEKALKEKDGKTSQLDCKVGNFPMSFGKLVENTVWGNIARQNFSLDDKLYLQLGFDSLDFIDVVMRIEKELGIIVPDYAISPLDKESSVQDFMDIIKKLTEEKLENVGRQGIQG